MENIAKVLVICPLYSFLLVLAFPAVYMWQQIVSILPFEIFDRFVLYFSSDTGLTVAAQIIWLLLFWVFHVVLKEASNCCFAQSNLAETGIPSRAHLCCSFPLL